MTDIAALSLAVDRRAIDDTLAEFCATELGSIQPQVAEAIRYSLLGGGKRLRAMLVAAASGAAVMFDRSIASKGRIARIGITAMS